MGLIGTAHPPPLLAANHGARSPSVSLTTTKYTRVCRLQPMAGQIDLHAYCRMPARRGGAKLTSFIGHLCSPPTTTRGSQAPKVPAAFLILNCCFSFPTCPEFDGLHDLYEFLNHLSQLCCAVILIILR